MRSGGRIRCMKCRKPVIRNPGVRQGLGAPRDTTAMGTRRVGCGRADCSGCDVGFHEPLGIRTVRRTDPPWLRTGDVAARHRIEPAAGRLRLAGAAGAVSLDLPNYPEGGAQTDALAGARLMQYRGENVAYVAYEMDSKPISLLISSSERIMPSSAESYRSGGLTLFSQRSRACGSSPGRTRDLGMPAGTYRPRRERRRILRDLSRRGKRPPKIRRPRKAHVKAG